METGKTYQKSLKNGKESPAARPAGTLCARVAVQKPFSCLAKNNDGLAMHAYRVTMAYKRLTDHAYTITRPAGLLTMYAYAVTIRTDASTMNPCSVTIAGNRLTIGAYLITIPAGALTMPAAALTKPADRLKNINDPDIINILKNKNHENIRNQCLQHV